jgi:hypothetical protein
MREELTQLEAQIARVDAGAQAAVEEYRTLKAELAKVGAKGACCGPVKGGYLPCRRCCWHCATPHQ